MHQMQFVVLNHLMNFRLCRAPVCMSNKKGSKTKKERKKERNKQTNKQDWIGDKTKKKISNGDPKWFKKNTKKTVKNAI